MKTIAGSFKSTLVVSADVGCHIYAPGFQGLETRCGIGQSQDFELINLGRAPRPFERRHRDFLWAPFFKLEGPCSYGRLRKRIQSNSSEVFGGTNINASEVARQ